ncbi:MAG: hypothetical protein AB7I18_10040 [Candidatus Berkiella sp.]
MAEQVSFIKAFGKIKEAFSSFSHLELGEGFSKLAEIGGDVISFAISGLAAYLIVDVIQNENMSTRQKILPSIGYSLGILVALPLAIIIIAGGSMLIPPFMFAASCVAVVRNMATYLEERAERNNLKKELISTEELKVKIAKAHLPADTENSVNDYLGARDTLYAQLYKARSKIIKNGSLSVKEKRSKVLMLNKMLEDLYLANQEDPALQETQLQQMVVKLKEEGFQKLSEKVHKYQVLCHSYHQASMAPSLRKAIMLYQFSHEKIFTQDLPADTKIKLIELMEGKKIKEEDLQLLYSHLGNQFINQTPLQQIKMQDENFQRSLKKFELSQDKISIINQHLQQPRLTYDKMIELRENLPILLKDAKDQDLAMQLFEKFREVFIQYPGNCRDKWQALKNYLGDSPLTKEVEDEFTKQLHISNQYLGLKADRKIQTVVEEHRSSTLAQYANSHQAEFPAPRFDFDLKANDLLMRAGIKPAIKKGYTNLKQAVQNLSDKTKDKVLQKIAREEPSPQEGLERNYQATLSQEKIKIREEFNQRYEGVFNIVKKKERLNFLVKSVPRRLLNVFLSLGVAGASLATTIIIPAVASPAAPAAVVGGAVIGALSATLTVASLVNSAQLILKNIRGKLKLSRTHTTLSEGVLPDTSFDEKIRKSGQKKLSNQMQTEETSQRPSAVIVSSGLKTSASPGPSETVEVSKKDKKP